MSINLGSAIEDQVLGSKTIRIDRIHYFLVARWKILNVLLTLIRNSNQWNIKREVMPMVKCQMEGRSRPSLSSCRTAHCQSHALPRRRHRILQVDNAERTSSNGFNSGFLYILLLEVWNWPAGVRCDFVRTSLDVHEIHTACRWSARSLFHRGFRASR